MRSRRLRDLASLAGLATVYFASAKLGLLLAVVHPSATAVWPPTGIALAALLVLGLRVWPAVFIGAFLANLSTAGSLATSLAIAGGNTLEGVVGAALVNRFANGRRAFDRVQDVLLFVLLAGLVSTALSATSGVTSLSLAGFARWSDYGSVWLTWWLGDVAANLLVAPALILWAADPPSRPDRQDRLLAAVQVLLLLGVGLVVFTGLASAGIRNQPLEFLCIPLVVWIAFRLGQREAATATLALSGIAIWGTLRGSGPFGGYPPNEALLLLQIFMASVALTSLGFGAAVLERKRAERALGETEERFRTVFEESKDAILVIDPDGRLVDVNPAAVELLGASSRADLRGLGFPDLAVRAEDPDALCRALAERGFLRDFPFALQNKAGRQVDVLVTISLVRGPADEVMALHVIARDVTETKRLEAELRQAQKLEAVGRLAAGVAHEINNPLTYVLVQLEELERDLAVLKSPPPGNARLDEMTARVQEAADGAKRVRRIVGDLKTFTHMDEENRTAVDVNFVLAKAIDVVSKEIRFRGSLVRTFGEAPPVLANEARMLQVFVKLLINAAQAVEDRDSAPSLVRVASRAEDGEVVVEIADTGRGIAPEHLDKLFDPFFTTKNVGEGSGLGLSICHNIVTSFGGRIEVESALGEGSRFTVRLPAAPPGTMPAAREPAKREAEPARKRTRVLVVDDEPLVRSSTVLILGRRHEVAQASSGREALDMICERGESFDTILCDLMMRDVSGMDLYAALRDRRADLARRIVFMTGGAYTQRAADFLKAVPNRCVEKPFGSEELLSAVQEVLDGAGRGVSL